MKIIELNPANKQHIQWFHLVAKQINSSDSNWIMPLQKDVEAVFDAKQNKHFQYGVVCRWLLTDDSGNNILGRVAAFIDQRLTRRTDRPIGGMGFFECINDQTAANLLFDTCKNWLAKQGIAGMDGPINFGERDKWWGLLIDGFLPPNYCSNYNPAYYQALFENYGFKLYFKQFTYTRNLEDKFSDKIMDRATRIMNNPEYSFDHLHKNQIKKFTEDFRQIYNKAWAKHAGVKPMSELQAKNMMKQIRFILDEETMIFGYHNGEPIGFSIMLPEMNQVFKHFKGKFNQKNPIDLLRLLWYRHIKGVNKIIGMVFGVVPEHQGKGVEAMLNVYYSGICWRPNYPYKYLEMNWIGDFNPKMMRVSEDIGAKIGKTHITYRYLFDTSLTVERCAIIGA